MNLCFVGESNEKYNFVLKETCRSIRSDKTDCKLFLIRAYVLWFKTALQKFELSGWEISWLKKLESTGDLNNSDCCETNEKEKEFVFHLFNDDIAIDDFVFTHLGEKWFL